MKRTKLSEQARAAKLEKDRMKIERYRKLSSAVLDAKDHKIYTLASLEDTTALLDLNPEYNAAWNFRRNIMVDLFRKQELNAVDALSTDLRMVMDMMKQFPKCYWIWNHRKWCLEELDDIGAAKWDHELAIVLKLLELDARNFHGWHYRRYVTQKIEEAKLRQVAAEDKVGEELRLLLGEFQFTTQKINRNISNFSAWHNRTILLRRMHRLVQDVKRPQDFEGYEQLINSFQSTQELIKHELNLVKTGMYMDSDDTSVWLYMKWLLTCDVFSLCCDVELLSQQLKDIEELNALEREDSKDGKDNAWCLKMIVFLRALISQKSHTDIKKDAVIEECLRKLVELDPLRKGHYLEQIAGKAPLIS